MYIFNIILKSTSFPHTSLYQLCKFFQLHVAEVLPYVHMLRHDLLMLIDYLVVIAPLMSKTESLTDYEELR